MLEITESCPTRDSDIRILLDAWLDSHARQEGLSDRTKLEPADQAFAYNQISGNLYDHLSVIDNKASALIASNSVVTGIILALIFNIDKLSVVRLDYLYFINTLNILLIFSIAAVISNLSVLGVVWSNANDFHKVGDQVSEEARLLVRTRSVRTIRLRISLYLHIFVIACTFIVCAYTVIPTN